LQDEFLRLLYALKKTIVFVTHDIDEALKMGTRIAILRAGRVVRFDRPEAILAHPGDPFVAAFVGADRALKRLALLPVASHMRQGDAASDSPSVSRDGDLRDALSILLAAGAEAGVVVDAAGEAAGIITLADIRSALAAPPAAND
jgi:osmoprotectant transport system ATP-binding protein